MMNITTRVKMDLCKPDTTLHMDAVQGDAYSRSVELALYSGITAWTIPEDIKVAVRYCKSDHTKGYYDTMPDGTSAWDINGNILTVRLAPQMLTASGTVNAQVEMIQGVHTLSTFRLEIYVQANPASGILKSEDYVNWLQWIKEQSIAYTQMVEHSAEKASQSALEANTAAQAAAASAQNVETAVKQAEEASASARTASVAAIDAQRAAQDCASGVSAIVAGNEAYTKRESDLQYGPAIILSVKGAQICI